MAASEETPKESIVDDLDNLVVDEEEVKRAKRAQSELNTSTDVGGRPRGAGRVYRGVKLRKNRKRPRTGGLAYGESRKYKAVQTAIKEGKPVSSIPVEDLPQSKIDPLTGKLKIDAPNPRAFATEGEYLDAFDRHITGKNGSDPKSMHSHPWTLAHIYEPREDMSIAAKDRGNLKPNGSEGRSSHSIKTRVMRIASVFKALNPDLRVATAPVIGEHRWEVWTSPSICTLCNPASQKTRFAMPPAVRGEAPAANLSDPAFKHALEAVRPTPKPEPVVQEPKAPRPAPKPAYVPKTPYRRAAEQKSRTDNKLSDTLAKFSDENKASLLEKFMDSHKNARGE